MELPQPSSGVPRFDDVRMRGFAQRTPVAEALRWLDARLAAMPGHLSLSICTIETSAS